MTNSLMDKISNVEGRLGFEVDALHCETNRIDRKIVEYIDYNEKRMTRMSTLLLLFIVLSFVLLALVISTF